MKPSLKKLPKSQVELTFDLDTEKLEKERQIAFEKIASQVKVPGFRPGRAPRKLLEERVNPTAPLQQALDVVLNERYQELLKEFDLVPVSQPQVNIESVDLSKPIKVELTVQVRPEAKVGDYKKIKAERKVEPVTDEKVEDTLQTVFERSTAQPGHDEHIPDHHDHEGHDHHHPVDPRQVPSGQGSEGLVDAQGNPLTSNDKPTSAMDDEWAKKLGAKDLADLKAQIHKDLEQFSESEADQEFQDKVLEELIKMTKVELPDAFIEDELSRMRAHYQQQLAGLGITMDQYLQQAGKTQEQMDEQWKPQAIKQATLEVALAEIAKQEKIDIDPAEVDAELAKVDEKTRAQFNDPQQRYFLTYSLWRQKVLNHVLEAVRKEKE